MIDTTKHSLYICLMNGTRYPIVFANTVTDDDEKALGTWIGANPGLHALVTSALELVDDEVDFHTLLDACTRQSEL